MKHGIYGILAVLLALLLAFQLPMTSFAAAEEAAPEEEAEEDEDEAAEKESEKAESYEEAAEEDEDEPFDEADDDEEDEEDDIYYVIYNMDGFSFDVNWDWSRKTEKLDYGTRTIFSTEDGFSVNVVMINLEAAELAVQDILYEEYPDADPDDEEYIPTACCILSGISCPSGDELKAETIDLTGYQDLSEALYWYIYDEEAFVKGGFFSMDDYILIISADCAELTPAQDTTLIRALSTVEWTGPSFDEEDEDDEDAEEDEEDDADSLYEKYFFDGFSFEVDPDWEAEEEEVYEGCNRVTFTVDDDFSFGVASISGDNAQDIIYAIFDEFPDLDFSSDDVNHRFSCYLCGVDCPSGKGLKPSELDVSDYYDDLDTAVLYFIYDRENYAKGGAFSIDGSGIIVAADCTEMKAEYDAAVTRVLSTIAVAEEEPDLGPQYEDIFVPEIEQNTLAIDPITPNTATADPAEFLTFEGEMTAKEQKDVYTFTAPYDGRYRIELNEMKGGTSMTLGLYDADGTKIEQISSVSNGKGITAKGLFAGETYEIRVKQYSNYFGSYVLTVGLQKPTIDISDLTELNDSIEYTDQRNVYTFTPAIDGRYRFEIANMKSGIEVELYVFNDLEEKIDSITSVTNGRGLTVKGLMAGETYTVLIRQHNKLGDYTLIIGQQKDTVDISDLTAISDSIEYTDQRNVYSFTVPRDGRYRFEMAEMKSGFDVELLVFNDLGEKVDSLTSAANGRGLTLKGLLAGDTYTVQIRQHSKLGDYTLLIGQQKETVEISDHYIIHDSIEFTDQRNVYSFTAETDGDYTFTLGEMASGMEVSVYLFNYLGETLESKTCRNDSYISIKNVSAGDYIELQIRYNKKLGSYTLTVN